MYPRRRIDGDLGNIKPYLLVLIVSCQSNEPSFGGGVLVSARYCSGVEIDFDGALSHSCRWSPLCFVSCPINRPMINYWICKYNRWISERSYLFDIGSYDTRNLLSYFDTWSNRWRDLRRNEPGWKEMVKLIKHSHTALILKAILDSLPPYHS